MSRLARQALRLARRHVKVTERAGLPWEAQAEAYARLAKLRARIRRQR